MSALASSNVDQTQMANARAMGIHLAALLAVAVRTPDRNQDRTLDGVLLAESVADLPVADRLACRNLPHGVIPIADAAASAASAALVVEAHEVVVQPLK